MRKWINIKRKPFNSKYWETDTKHSEIPLNNSEPFRDFLEFLKKRNFLKSFLICFRVESFPCWGVSMSPLICMDATFFVWVLIDATDRSKISSNQKRLFFTVSLYPLSFFGNTPFNAFLKVGWSVSSPRDIEHLFKAVMTKSDRHCDYHYHYDWIIFKPVRKKD